MASVNRVTLVGRLGKDPDIKKTSSGKALARFSVATTSSWTDKSGEKKEQTDWHTVVAWGGFAEVIGKNLAKGDQVYIEGKLQTRTWETDGQTKYFTEVIVSDYQKLTPTTNPISTGDGIGSDNNEFPF